MPTINGTDGNNVITGTADDDVIIARGGSDTIDGGGGNDVITLRVTPGGSDVIDGGAGIDIVTIDATYTSFTVSQSGNRLIFTAPSGAFTETLTGVEQVAFDDQTIFIVGAGGFATIQAAVDAAPAGTLILVAGGTYTEQLVVSGKSGLTIAAVPGATVTIAAPANVTFTGLSSSGRDINAVVTVVNSTDIVFSGITVDGRGVGNTIDEGPGAGAANFVGVFYRNSTGGLDDVDITGVRSPYEAGVTAGGNPIVSGVQTGVGLQVDNDTIRGFFMHDGSIVDFQKNGTVFNRVDLDFDGVTVTGGGAQPINAQNGLQILNSTGTITNSTITGIGYAGPADAYSGGILAYGNTDLAITNNVVTGSNGESTAAKVVGIYVFDLGPDNSGGSITGNSISHVDVGIDVSGGLGPNSIAINNNTITNIDLTDPFAGGVSFLPDGNTNDTVSGSDGIDFLSGGAGTDTLSGLGGNDVLDGGTGSDALNGGMGTDTAVYAGPILGYSYVVAYDSSGFATGFSSVTLTSSGDVDTLSSIEILQFGNATLDLTAPVQLLDADGDLIGTFTTIQGAVDAAGSVVGAVTILVNDGNYAESVIIDRSDLTLKSVNGRGATTITGVDGAALGAIEIDPGANNVTIGGVGSGFTIVGLNGNGPVEKAGIYLQGAHDNIDIIGNNVVANGDAGLLGEFNQNNSNILIDGNIFSGQTFVGPNPSGTGFGQQFDVGNNVPRQLVVFGSGNNGAVGTNVVFTNNVVSGTAGGISTTNGLPLGNTLVTIDVPNSVISDNDFTGNTTGNGYAIRARSADTDIGGNELTGDSAGIFVNNGGVPGTYGGNSFTGTPGVDIVFGMTDGADTVTTFDGDDQIGTSGGNDTIDAGGGNDIILAGAGSDSIGGGSGTDTAVFSNALSASTVTAVSDGDGRVTSFTSVTTGMDVDTLTSVERLQFSDVTLDLTAPVQLFDANGDLIGTFTTIQGAVDAASAGFTIRVMAGTFAGDVVVSKDVTIVGANGGIAGTGTRGAETIITGDVSITGTGATFDGVTFSGEFTPGGAPWPVGVYITGNNSSIVNSVFTTDSETVVAAILTGSVTGLDIGDNLFEGYPIGAYVSGGATTGSIHDNRFQGEWTPITLPEDFAGMGNGVNSESSTLTITENTFDGLYAGTIQVLADGPATLDVTTIVFDNILTSNRDQTPVNIFPNGVVTTVNGTDLAEDFNGDQVAAGRDFIFDGNGGNDRLFGADGNDNLTGGTGNDQLYGGNGTDTAAFAFAIAPDDISAIADSNPFDPGNQAGWSVFGGSEGTDTLDDIEIVTSVGGGRILLVGGGGFATIQAAVDAANDGDTIMIAAGSYAEDVTVDVGVTILGAHYGTVANGIGRDAAAGVGETNITGNWRVTSTADVSIDGLRFINDATTTGGAGNVILAILTGGNVSGHDISNSIFWSTIAGGANGVDDRAIQVSPIATGSVSIEDNLISGTSTGAFGTAAWGRGIWSDGGGVAVTIDANTFQSTRTAINLDMAGTTVVTVSSNTVSNAGTFLSVGTDADGLTVTDNGLTNVGTDFNFRNLTTDVTFDASAAIDTVTPVSPANPGQDAVVILGGSGNDTLTGTAGADIIDGNNLLFANGDSDTLTGGLGNDQLYGRGGNDTAAYSETVTLANIVAVADADPLTAGNQTGWTVTTAGGTDNLVDIEVVSHAGGTIRLVGNGGYATIQEAVDASVDGDTILIAAGSYAEDVLVDVGVTIVGAKVGVGGTGIGRDAAAGAGETSIVGNWQVTSAANVTIDGLRFVNDATTTGGPANPPLWFQSGGTTGHSVTNSIFWSTIVGAASGDRAIQISPIATGAVSITDNLISGTQQGLFGTASWDRGIWSDGGGVAVTIDGNTISWARTAINLDMAGTTTALVSDNNLTNSGSGISVGTDVDGLTLIGNDISNVGTEFNFRNLTTAVTFNADTAIDVLTLGSGVNDTVIILGGSGGDTLTGTAGADFIDGNNSPTSPSALDADTLNGGGGDDSLFGRFGDDVLDGGTGTDVLNGGDGNDLLVVDSLTDQALGGAGIDTVRTTTETYTLSAENENLTAAGSPDALTGTGNSLDNIITGSSFDDTLSGLGGLDLIYGGDGNDTAIGGEGNDELYGQVGDDTLVGGNGNDRLEGGVGTDTAVGGAGDDVYYVDSAADLAVESSNQGSDTVFAVETDYALGANIETLTYVGTGNFTGTGNALSNLITGGSGTDNLIGGDGNDILQGGLGTDRLEGGAGDDTYYTEDRFEVIVEALDGGTDTLITSADKVRLSNNLENVIGTRVGGYAAVGNALDNVLTGTNFDDILQAKGGNDTLIGNDGSDQLLGSIGMDVLTGGAGADLFIFAFAEDSLVGTADRITDFSSAQGDRIDLLTIDAIDGGSDDSFTFIGDSAFGSVAGQLRAYIFAGNTFVEGDTNGDGVADFVIQIDGTTPVSNGDFLL